MSPAAISPLLRGGLKYILTLTIVCVWQLRAQAEEERHDWGMEEEEFIDSFFTPPVVTPSPPDSADVKRLEHKAFWRASAEVVGFNLGLWAYDRFIEKGEYAYISWNSIKENFRHGFEWDNDYLGTNMFAHPYSGSLYYNAGRSNGYNFWQSSIFAIGGSAMWEMFMEKEYPSTNDIIATPIGGSAIGEVLYRTSDLVIDDRATGAERFGRELAGFVISPMRGFTRIVTGRAWQHRATSGKRFGIPPVRLSFSLGTRLLLYHHQRNLSQAGLTGRISIEYGEKYEEKTRQPYDYFTFQLDMDVMKSQPFLSRLEIQGRLLSKELLNRESANLTLGMYQHFDYFDSDTITKKDHFDPLPESLVPYKFGTPASVGAGTLGRYTFKNLWEIEGYAHVNAVVLGGILSDFYHNYHRNYNWGSGFALKGGFRWSMPRMGITAGANARFYRIYTLKGYALDPMEHPQFNQANVQGDRSNASFFNLNANFNFRIKGNLWMTTIVDWYRRYSHYPDITLKLDDLTYTGSPILTSNQIGLKIMLSYML